MTKQQRIEELEKRLNHLTDFMAIQHEMYGEPEELLKRAETAEAEVRRLNRELNQTSQVMHQGEILEEAGLSIFYACNEEPPCYCISFGNGVSLNIFTSEAGAEGVIVADGPDTVAWGGYLPAKIVKEVNDE